LKVISEEALDRLFKYVDMNDVPRLRIDNVLTDSWWIRTKVKLTDEHVAWRLLIEISDTGVLIKWCSEFGKTNLTLKEWLAKDMKAREEWFKDNGLRPKGRGFRCHI